jgi:hypothetical protein
MSMQSLSLDTRVLFRMVIYLAMPTTMKICLVLPGSDDEKRSNVQEDKRREDWAISRRAVKTVNRSRDRVERTDLE